MLPSPAAYELIKAHEGLRLNAYRDPVGVWTIGYGHAGKDVRAGQSITVYQALDLLKLDMDKAAAAVNRRVKVPLNQGQFDALVSFVFNLGEGRLAESTLLQKLNGGDYAAAANELLRWNKSTVNGRKVALRGLTRRREAEKALFLGGAS